MSHADLFKRYIFLILLTQIYLDDTFFNFTMRAYTK